MRAPAPPWPHPGKARASEGLLPASTLHRHLRKVLLLHLPLLLLPLPVVPPRTAGFVRLSPFRAWPLHCSVSVAMCRGGSEGPSGSRQRRGASAGAGASSDSEEVVILHHKRRRAAGGQGAAGLG